VAVVDGRFLSIFDGQTEYVLHAPRFLRTGIWVCPTIAEVVSHAQHLPQASALRDAPRAILRLLCWNADGTTPMYDHSHGSVDKMRATNVMPTALLPFSARSSLQPPASGSYGNSTHRRAGVRGPRGVEAQLDARRTYGTGSRWRTRMQAQTVQLHEDVALMEERLALTRGVLQTSPSELPEGGWRRRALSASAPPALARPRTAPARSRRPMARTV
jgi:hypothetical protein